MDSGLVVTFVGIVVAGLAGVLGVWMERDRTSPPGWAYVFTGFIVLATGLKVVHSIAQKAENAVTEEAMARVLERLVALSDSGGGSNPALDQLVDAELAAQSRANPRVIDRVAVKVEARGGDPAALRRKAFAARRAAAGLPTRVKAKVAGKIVEEIVAPLVPGADGRIPDLPRLPVLDADGKPVDLPRVPGLPLADDEKKAEERAGRTGKTGKKR